MEYPRIKSLLFLSVFLSCLIETKCSQMGDVFPQDGLDDGNIMNGILSRLEQLEARDKKHQQDKVDLQRTIDSQNARITELENASQDTMTSKVKVAEPDSDGEHVNGTFVTNTRSRVSRSQMGKSRERRQQIKACAFYASIDNHHLQHLGANQDITFDKVYTNVGNGYHPNLGVFIAPEPGTYVFSTTIMDVNKHDSRYYYSVNGQAQGNLFIHGLNSYLSSSSRTVAFLLKAGDHVAIKNANVNEGVYGYEYSSFSGFMVSFDDSAGVVVG